MNDSAIHNIPKLYDDRNRPIYTSLEESKRVVKDWMEEHYEFRSMLDEKLENVDNCDSLKKLNTYIWNSVLHGMGLKVKNQQRKWGY